MKRTIAIKLLALVLLIATLTIAVVPSFVGCNDKKQNTTPKKTTAATTPVEPDQPEVEKDIPDELNLALQIDKLPKATPDMTTDELRDVVVAFMKFQLTFAYKADFSNCSEDSMSYYIKNLYSAYGGSTNLDNLKIVFEDGKYYGGIPYMGNTAGSIYRWLAFYNPETGAMDMAPIVRTDRKNWEDDATKIVYPSVGSTVFGNTCASSCVWAYLRVSNSLKTFWTNTWIPSNGYVKVGDYNLSKNDDHGTSTSKICQNNGKDVMYSCYALLRKADGLVQTGHAVMAVSDAVVVYNADGSINAEESYVLIAEQKASFLDKAPSKGGVDLFSPLNNNGLTYRVQGNFPGLTVNDAVKEMKWTFKFLYDEGYLPFTIPELIGEDDVEEVEVIFSHTDDTITMSQLLSQSVRSNYAISDIQLTVKDKEGNVVFTGMYAPNSASANPVSLRNFYISDALTNNAIYSTKDYINSGLEEYMYKNYTLEISARISTGDLITVWSGTYKR